MLLNNDMLKYSRVTVCWCFCLTRPIIICKMCWSMLLNNRCNVSVFVKQKHSSYFFKLSICTKNTFQKNINNTIYVYHRRLIFYDSQRKSFYKLFLILVFKNISRIISDLWRSRCVQLKAHWSWLTWWGIKVDLGLE